MQIGRTLRKKIDVCHSMTHGPIDVCHSMTHGPISGSSTVTYCTSCTPCTPCTPWAYDLNRLSWKLQRPPCTRTECPLPSKYGSCPRRTPPSTCAAVYRPQAARFWPVSATLGTERAQRGRNGHMRTHRLTLRERAEKEGERAGGKSVAESYMHTNLTRVALRLPVPTRVALRLPAPTRLHALPRTLPPFRLPARPLVHTHCHRETHRTLPRTLPPRDPLPLLRTLPPRDPLHIAHALGLYACRMLKWHWQQK